MEYTEKSKSTIILALETLLEQCEDCDINMSIEIEEINKLINTIKRKENKMKKLEFYARQESNSIEGIWRNSKEYSINTDDIEKIYYGGLCCCACGCEGTYTEPSDLVEFERLLKIFERDTKDYDVIHATYYDGDLNNVFEIETKERFGIRLYVKKKGE